MVAVDATYLGRTPAADKQGLKSCLVQPGHRAQGAGDEVQLVLDDEFRRTRSGADTEECAGPFFPSDCARTCR